MIRVFISTWSGVAGGDITNPIESYAHGIEERVVSRMFYPDADLDGVPDKPRVLVLVEGPPEIESFANLPGVTMLPPYHFNELISNVPQTVRDEVLASMAVEGIPNDVLLGSQTCGEVINRIASYFQAGHTSFGNMLEVAKAADFA